MPYMKITLDGTGCWPDLKDKPHINAMGGETRVEVAALPRGMESGKVSVTFRVEAPTGEIVIFETSLELLKAAVMAFEARYPPVTKGHDGKATN
jgi:hypothetical protein